MAKPKGTGISSYVRICDALTATPAYTAYERHLLERIQSLRVDGFGFHKTNAWANGDGMPMHWFEVACDAGRIEKFRFTHPGDFDVDLGDLVTVESLTFVLAQFGKTVSTFFCKPEAVAEKFTVHVRMKFSKAHGPSIAEAEARVNSQAKALLDGGRLDAARRQAYEDEAVEEIRRVLFQYRNVRQEVIRTALRLSTVDMIHGN